MAVAVIILCQSTSGSVGDRRSPRHNSSGGRPFDSDCIEDITVSPPICTISLSASRICRFRTARFRIAVTAIDVQPSAKTSRRRILDARQSSASSSACAGKKIDWIVGFVSEPIRYPTCSRGVLIGAASRQPRCQLSRAPQSHRRRKTRRHASAGERGADGPSARKGYVSSTEQGVSAAKRLLLVRMKVET